MGTYCSSFCAFTIFARLAKSIETSNCLCYYLYKVLYELISIVV